MSILFLILCILFLVFLVLSVKELAYKSGPFWLYTMIGVAILAPYIHG